MKRFLLSALTLAFAASMATGVDAKACRDAKGKFMKCKPPMTKSCRDAKGKFTKCHDAMHGTHM